MREYKAAFREAWSDGRIAHHCRLSAAIWVNQRFQMHCPGIGRKGLVMELPPSIQAGRSGLHSAVADGNGGNFYGTNPALPLLYPGPNPRMKQKHIATICLLALGLAVARAQELQHNIPGQTDQQKGRYAAPAPAKSNYTAAQLLEEFGWFIGKRVGLAELAFSKEEVDTLLKGIALAAS